MELVSHHLAARGLNSVQLVAEADKGGEFSIHQTADGTGLTTRTRLGSSQPIQRTVRSRTPDIVELLGREIISSVGRDRLYKQVSGVLSELRGAPGE